MQAERKQAKSGKFISGHGALNTSGGNVMQIFELQERVAQRIANRLHDECAQMLSVIYLALAEIAGDSPRVTARRIDGVVRHLDTVGEQLRSLSHELRPLVLDQFGLVPALSLLAVGVRKRAGLTLNLDTEVLPVLGSVTETAVYRIVQEALANVLRHAGATHATVTLRAVRGQVQCTITDNGCGFDPKGAGKGSGLGLLGIRERVAAMDGRCSIVSGRGMGTTLQVELPA